MTAQVAGDVIAGAMALPDCMFLLAMAVDELFRRFRLSYITVPFQVS
jgi:hypothetical protein